jgi:orotate phosphoribosyltransferase
LNKRSLGQQMKRRSKPGGDVIRLISFTLLAIAMSSVPSVASAQLKGDPHAVALAVGLVEAIGGRDLWQRAQYLYVEEQVYSLREFSEPIRNAGCPPSQSLSRRRS